MAVGEQAKAEFQSIKQTLLDHFEQAREALLDERAQRPALCLAFPRRLLVAARAGGATSRCRHVGCDSPLDIQLAD